MNSTIIKTISIGLVLAGTQASAGKQAEKTEKMNVLFIAVDDLRPELGCYGNKIVKSPNIDRLAKQGVLFESAYCQQAVCAPSRASLLSGCRPNTTNVLDLHSPLREKMPNVTSLPQHYKQNGYQVISLGKIYHHSGEKGDDPVSWSELEWKETGDWKGRGYVTPEAQKHINSGRRKGVGVGPSNEIGNVADNAYPDGVITDEAIRKLQEFKQSGESFFLGVGFHKPHLPFNAPKKYWDLYERDHLYQTTTDKWPEGMPSYAGMGSGELKGYTDIPDNFKRLEEDKANELIHGYYACVSYVDALIGNLVDELDQLGMRENTIIVLWGDHGWKLNDYGAWNKHTNFEIDNHVPLLVLAPGFKTGRKSKALVELVDIYPTLSELCELDKPVHCEGTSMVPLLKKPQRKWKEAAFSQYPRGDRMGHSIRSGNWRYTEWVNKNGKVVGRELYNHTDGPLAAKNLAEEAKYLKTVNRLSSMLLKGEGWRAMQKQD